MQMLLALKISLLIIGNFEKSRYLTGVNRNRLPCTYTHQKNAWMNSSIFSKWFKEDFVPQVLKRLRILKLLLCAILLLNNAPSHLQLRTSLMLPKMETSVFSICHPTPPTYYCPWTKDPLKDANVFTRRSSSPPFRPMMTHPSSLSPND